MDWPKMSVAKSQNTKHQFGPKLDWPKSVMTVNDVCESKQSQTLLWYKILPLNGDHNICAKQRLHRGDGKKFVKILETVTLAKRHLH